MVWDESVIGWNRFWMKVSWMKLSSLVDEMVLDESVFGWKCFWMKVFLDEFFFAIWMKVYLTSGHTTSTREPHHKHTTSTPQAHQAHHKHTTPHQTPHTPHTHHHDFGQFWGQLAQVELAQVRIWLDLQDFEIKNTFSHLFFMILLEVNTIQNCSEEKNCWTELNYNKHDSPNISKNHEVSWNMQSFAHFKPEKSKAGWSIGSEWGKWVQKLWLHVHRNQKCHVMFVKEANNVFICSEMSRVPCTRWKFVRVRTVCDVVWSWWWRSSSRRLVGSGLSSSGFCPVVYKLFPMTSEASQTIRRQLAELSGSCIMVSIHPPWPLNPKRLQSSNWFRIELRRLECHSCQSTEKSATLRWRARATPLFLGDQEDKLRLFGVDVRWERWVPDLKKEQSCFHPPTWGGGGGGRHDVSHKMSVFPQKLSPSKIWPLFFFPVLFCAQSKDFPMCQNLQKIFSKSQIRNFLKDELHDLTEQADRTESPWKILSWSKKKSYQLSSKVCIFSDPVRLRKVSIASKIKKNLGKTKNFSFRFNPRMLSENNARDSVSVRVTDQKCTTVRFPIKIQKILNDDMRHPCNFEKRIIFMPMFNNTELDQKHNENVYKQNSKNASVHAKAVSRTSNCSRITWEKNCTAEIVNLEFACSSAWNLLQSKDPGKNLPSWQSEFENSQNSDENNCHHPSVQNQWVGKDAHSHRSFDLNPPLRKCKKNKTCMSQLTSFEAPLSCEKHQGANIIVGAVLPCLLSHKEGVRQNLWNICVFLRIFMVTEKRIFFGCKKGHVAHPYSKPLSSPNTSSKLPIKSRPCSFAWSINFTAFSSFSYLCLLPSVFPCTSPIPMTRFSSCCCGSWCLPAHNHKQQSSCPSRFNDLIVTRASVTFFSKLSLLSNHNLQSICFFCLLWFSRMSYIPWHTQSHVCHLSLSVKFLQLALDNTLATLNGCVHVSMSRKMTTHFRTVW